MSSEMNRQLVERFWRTMNENDWRAAGQLFHDDYVLDWPQSGERIRGRANFAAINEHYPASGRWVFNVHRVIANDDGAASEVAVTNGAISAHALSFFEIRGGLIWRMTEYWPDPFEPAAWRMRWTERIDLQRSPQ